MLNKTIKIKKSDQNSQIKAVRSKQLDQDSQIAKQSNSQMAGMDIWLFSDLRAVLIQHLGNSGSGCMFSLLL